MIDLLENLEDYLDEPFYALKQRIELLNEEQKAEVSVSGEETTTEKLGDDADKKTDEEDKESDNEKKEEKKETAKSEDSKKKDSDVEKSE